MAPTPKQIARTLRLAQLECQQRELIARLQGRAQSEITDAEHAQAAALWLSLPKWEVVAGKPLADCAGYAEVMRAW